MMNDSMQVYGINVVARLTGLSSHVLRSWERRYQAVEPHRSDTRRRRYTRSDIQRLSLLKTLVDNGHAIGSIAELPTEQLEARVSQTVTPRPAPEEESEQGVCRIAVIGELVRKVVHQAADSLPALAAAGEFADAAAARQHLPHGAADLLVVERDTLFAEDLQEVQELVQDLGARRALLVYRFTQNKVLAPTDIRWVTALRAPVDAAEIRLAALADIQLAQRAARENSPPAPERTIDRPVLGEIPPHAYSAEQLARIADLPSAIECECPRHLANLLASLYAFERYSAQCEDRSPADARLHAYLHMQTAQSRTRMEESLAEVLAHEGISP